MRRLCIIDSSYTGIYLVEQQIICVFTGEAVYNHNIMEIIHISFLRRMMFTKMADRVA